MRRVHLEVAPEPVWVQTGDARWLQSAEVLTVIAHRVPRASCRSSALRVSISTRQVCDGNVTAV